jgi:hypothetical protein
MQQKSLLLALILIIQIACSYKTEKMQYKVTKIPDMPTINNDWDVTPWKEIDPLMISNFMGNKPEHFPDTQVKVAYDDVAIYIKFRVEDQYVKAVYEKNQDPVYQDSCVEFFFTPGEDIIIGYFNLEMNCGGTMLFHHQVEPRKNAVLISEDDIKQIQVISTLPKIVDPEIREKITWQVSYRIPFSILSNYHDFDKPQPGTIWRANFYKCADDTSHPHWLTWAPIDFPTPDFHRPAYFGELEF